MEQNSSQFTAPADFIRLDFERRKSKNPRFSLRAYAKSVGLSIGRLSEILSKKTPVSISRARKIAPHLKLEKEELELFWGLVHNEKIVSHSKVHNSESKTLSESDFSPIGDWEYFACMALFETSSSTTNLNWISQKLRIPLPRLEVVIQHLLSEGFIRIDGKQFLSCYKKISTKSNIPSQVLRKANKDRLEKTINDFESANILQKTYNT